MKSNRNVMAAILGVIYFVMMVTIIVIKKDSLESASFVSILFMTVAYAIAIGVIVTSKGDMNSFFLKMPLYSASVTYVIIESLVAVAFIMSEVTNMTVIFLVQFIMFGIYMISVLKASAVSNAVTKAEGHVASRQSFIQDATIAIEGVKMFTNDYELKKSISLLVEEIKYSIPKDSPSLNDIQYEIFSQINNLKMAVRNNDIKTSNDTILYIKNLIAERNNMCKMIR